MLINSEKECSKEIIRYFDNEPIGHTFIVNIDDNDSYNHIMSTLNADKSKTIVRVSDYCVDNNLPNIDKLFGDAKSIESGVIVGLSQYAMLRSENFLKQTIDSAIHLNANGHIVVLVRGCSNVLKKLIAKDSRLDNFIVVSECGFKLPKVILAKNNNHSKESVNLRDFFKKLEDDVDYNGFEPETIIVATQYTPLVFKDSMYTVSEGGGIYDLITKKYSEIAAFANKEWGKDKQWEGLYTALQKFKSLSAIIENMIGNSSNLEFWIDYSFGDNDKSWYIWLAMKCFGVKHNKYLSEIITKSQSVKEFVRLIYMNLLEHSKNEKEFERIYTERKHLIERLPENLSQIQEYCNHIGQFDKDAIYYLTDLTDKERLLFLKHLSKYNYETKELRDVCRVNFPEIYTYMQEFVFTKNNMNIPSGDVSLHKSITDYFNEYKLQKLTNKIHPGFIDRVIENAQVRPYNKLLPRISVIGDIDKSKAQIHFFDALGVEFLSYIRSKCEKYDLQTVIHTAHCELPSITSQNKDFIKFFKVDTDENGNQVLPGTKELDELKHHSKEIDYRKCPEPIYLFEELRIIDAEIRKIKDVLVNKDFEKVIIISDHGASRLSVIYQNECEFIDNDNKGEHSGRCCKVDEELNIPYVTYNNGYAIIANYDRFKGSRAANVEVHGGASLEEVLVPIIEISQKPEETEIYIVNKYIEFHNKDIVTITIYSNIQISEPKLIVQEIANNVYEGKPIDNTHTKFEIPEIKRSGKFTVDLFDGDNLVISNLEFETKKAISKSKDYF